jgi:hypothetical protein
MPDRAPDDGPISVRRVAGTEILEISCNGESLFVSPFNAWRIFGALALMLDIPLSKNVARTIRF